jgi:hypothetical protein
MTVTDKTVTLELRAREIIKQMQLIVELSGKISDIVTFEDDCEGDDFSQLHLQVMSEFWGKRIDRIQNDLNYFLETHFDFIAVKKLNDIVVAALDE